MKKSNLILIFFVLISLTNSFSQREIRLTNMNFIPEGEFIEDSTRTILFKSFWLSNQITNKEFREFWNYAKNNPNEELEWAELSLPADIKTKSQPIFKRIKYSELTKETISKKNWPSDNYFESNDFNDKPVIGVSNDLANYYCIWKTSKTYDSLKEEEKNPAFSYYLPTTSQINYAQKLNPSLFAEKEVGFRISIDK